MGSVRFAILVLAMAAAASATAIILVHAQTATDTVPIEGQTVLPDGTEIPMTLQQSPTASDTPVVLSIGTHRQLSTNAVSFQAGLSVQEKLDLILDKVQAYGELCRKQP